MKKNKSLKNSVKRILYETRGIKPKTLISLMLIGGILFSILYSTIFAYENYATSSAKVNLFYQEIADAQYPDHSRFTYYDLVDVKRVEAALDIVQERGIYENFTAQDLRDCFFVYSSLDSSVGGSVEYARTKGSNYSYVANEYDVVFRQPHDYKNRSVINRFFGKDYSREFLQVLMEVNYEYFVENKGGVGGFERLTDAGDLSNCDYSEKVDAYNFSIDAIIYCLNTLASKSDNFTSTIHNRTLSDIAGEYKLLKNDLNTISSFIESSGLTRDFEVTRNKINTNLEREMVNLKKSTDLYNINKFAQDSYDHTFTENLIVVALDDWDGLYQARPKTAFDTVVSQKHEAMEDMANHTAEINDLNKTLTKNDLTTHSGEEYERLCNKCEALQGTFDEEYRELCKVAGDVVGEFYDHANKGFLYYRVEADSILNMDFLTRNAGMFAVGCICAFVLSVILNSCQEFAKVRKKKKILDALQHREM